MDGFPDGENWYSAGVDRDGASPGKELVSQLPDHQAMKAFNRCGHRP